MRSLRLLLPVIAVVSVAATGCGGGSSGSALDDALGYLPDDAPLVVTFDTDVEGDQFKAAQEILERLPFGDRIQDEVEDQIEDGGLSFEDDLKPLLGNEFVVGATDVSALEGNDRSAPGTSFGDDEDEDQDEQFVGAIRVKDKDKLEDLAKKEADEEGEVDGAKIYEENGGDDVFAIKDDVLVMASTRSQLEDALEQRGEDDRLTAKKFEKSVDGLPDEALVKIGGDVREMLEAGSADALEVKWVRALRTFGATVSVKGEEAELDFKLATAGGDLTEQDLPFATGDDSPPALDVPGEVGIGIRDPSQFVRFFEAALDEAEPGQLATAKRALESRLKIDVEEDLLEQLQDDVAVSISPRGSVGARIELEDEPAFRRTLTKIERTFPPSSSTPRSPRTRCRRVRIPGTTRTRFTCTPRIRCRRVRVPGTQVRRLSCTPGYTTPVTPTLGPRLTKIGDVTQIRTSGGENVAYAIDDGALLIADYSYRVNQLRRQEPEDVPGAKGSVSMKADAGPLLLAALRSSGLYYRLGLSGTLGGTLGGTLSGSLDDLTGSMRTSEDGLVGNVKVTLD